MIMSSGALTFIVVVFLTVFLLSQGMIIPVFGESRKARRRLKKRLGDIERELGQESLSSLLREKYLRELSPWERALERLPLMESLSGVIEQAGKSVLAYRLVLLAAVLAAGGGFLAWSFSHQWLLALAGLGAGAALPFVKIFRDRSRRILKIEEQLPEAVDMMKRALRAGHPFSGAIKLVGEEMPEPLAQEFKNTFADLNYGNDVRRAMLGLLQRIPSVPVMALVTSVLVQKETGGNLAEILEQISTVIRGRFRLERKVRTLSAEGRMSTWVLALVPLVLFAVIWITTPDYLPTMLDDPFGQKLVTYGLVSAVVGVIWIRRIIRIDV
jgi:tight adherence protein B